VASLCLMVGVLNFRSRQLTLTLTLPSGLHSDNPCGVQFCGLSPRTVWFDGALAEDIVLYSLARHLTLSTSLHPQVYKWLPKNSMLGVTPG